MTDNEIKKALKCCGRKHNEKNDTYCKECQFKSYLPCVAFLCDRTIDLINRQKAEIERLKKKANTPFAKITFDRDKLQEIVDERVKNIEIDINLVKSEAIKEFIDELKNRVVNKYEYTDIRVFKEIDNLVKEMTEVNENDRA